MNTPVVMVQLQQQFAEEEAADPEGPSPQHSPRSVREKECAPRHAVHAGEEGSEDAEKSNETAKELPP
jgi:hypothetical protein